MVYNKGILGSEDRKRAILSYLLERKRNSKGGDCIKNIASAVKGVGSEVTVSKTLADLLTDDLVVRTKGSRNRYGGYLYWWNITPKGEMRLADISSARDGRDTALGDWSVTPTLMPRTGEGDVAAVPAVSVTAPAPAVPRAPTEEADVASLVKALDSLRAIRTGDEEVDRTAGLLAAKVADRVGSAIAPCPCCGAAMKVQCVGDNRALECTGCHIAVTYRGDPADLNALVRRWARRVRSEG